MKPQSYNNQVVTAYFTQQGLPKPIYEHKFHPTRKWRFDIAFPSELIAIEVEGGVFTGGRHTNPQGFIRDMEKYNEATRLGWRVIRVIPQDLCLMDTVRLVKDVIALRR